jgi:hypothetical protein
VTNEPPPASPQPLALQYAGRAEQYGIILDRSPGGVRITIPPRFLKFLPPVTIELDSTYLRLEGVGNEWDESGSMERPRGAIYDVSFVPHSGRLFIKARGFDFIECRPHRDPKVVEWIAERINEALRFVPPRVDAEGSPT